MRFITICRLISTQFAPGPIGLASQHRFSLFLARAGWPSLIACLANNSPAPVPFFRNLEETVLAVLQMSDLVTWGKKVG
jgi:hypothetical protein